MPKELSRQKLNITGIVQGVGFRPFIYGLAKQHGLFGWIQNNPDGVLIDIEGESDKLQSFILDITHKAPPLSYIEQIQQESLQPVGYAEFKIVESSGALSHNVFISPDVSICNDCLSEMNSQQNRRYQYPFINCTNCGPRFTITKDIPYDRINTVMEKFKMCTACSGEYENPSDRRFHAQPISCYNCGPTLQIFDNYGTLLETKNQMNEVRTFLKEGKIIALKGLGGFHLTCMATDNTAVNLLRKRKHRDGKPFALMAKDIDVVKKYCIVNEKEEELLTENKKPIVLLQKLHECLLPEELSTDNDRLGVMLPYTPLHHLLFQSEIELLVMTSGNISGEPISYTDTDALDKLSHIADYFLIHDRDIFIRTDDSVTSVFNNNEYIIRRSRGYVPFPTKIPLPDSMNSESVPPILSTGGELKNTFCITKKNSAFLSHHIGDLENIETLDSFHDGINHFKKIFMVNPKIVACDLHPEYLSTKYAECLKDVSIVKIQHHHAHIASCMAENGLSENVIGVAFDGTGYGEDGNIWGGEFFSGDYTNFKREAHFKYVPVPGGEVAIKEPWRMALGFFSNIFENDLNKFMEFGQKQLIPYFEKMDWKKCEIVYQQIQKGINSPLTSSAGRLFDAVSSLLGLCHKISYEGQGAILLEKYSQLPNMELFDIEVSHNPIYDTLTVDTVKLFNDIFDSLVNGESVPVLARKFHNSLAKLIEKVCAIIREKMGINKVVLSGGVFQNRLLLSLAIQELVASKFEVYTHRKIPTNDGGISLGQAAIAMWKFSSTHPSLF